MLSGRISWNSSENIFSSYTGLKAWNKQNIFFRWQIEIYFISWTSSVIFSLVAASPLGIKMLWITACIIGMLSFFLLKILIYATGFYWRNDTHNLCHLTVFIPKLVRPSACSSFDLFVIQLYLLSLLFFFFKLFPSMAPMTNATQVLLTLWL